MHYLEGAAIADGEDGEQVHEDDGFEHAVFLGRLRLWVQDCAVNLIDLEILHEI
jgi:hypothetical protein